MKISFWQWFKAGVALGAGIELGKLFTCTTVALSRRELIPEIKNQYRRGMEDLNERNREDAKSTYGIRSVMTEDERNRTTEH